MKLSYEYIVQIYELRKLGQRFKQLSKRFDLDVSELRYIMKLIDRYGIKIVKKGKNCYYSPELKKEMIDKVLLEGGKRKTEIVQGFVTEFSLDILLKIIKLSRSTYYYHLKYLGQTDKNQELEAVIQAIYC